MRPCSTSVITTASKSAASSSSGSRPVSSKNANVPRLMWPRISSGRLRPRTRIAVGRAPAELGVDGGPLGHEVSSLHRMKVVLLPGDCIGPEIAIEARRVLELLAPDVELEEHLFGGAAIREVGTPLPAGRRSRRRSPPTRCSRGRSATPSSTPPTSGPSRACSAFGKALDVYANLRPSRAPGIDLLIVRELVGGLYFGEKGTRPDGTVYDTCEYHPDQIERIVRRGFELARTRRRPAHVGRQGERDGDVAALAPGRRRAGAGVPGRRRRAHARRQRGDAARARHPSSSTSS